MCLGYFCVDYMSTDMCQSCEWNSKQLTECITHVSLFWLTARGISSQTPFIQYCLGLAAWLAPIPEWGNSWGFRMPTSSFLISLPACSGKLEGRRPGLILKRFLDGPLHQAGVIERACYSLHKALCSHSSTFLALPSRATTLEGSLDLVPRKATNSLLRLFSCKRLKKLPSSLCSKHRD